MSVATITPHPRLAVVASEARKEARAQKREKNPLRKLVRVFTVTLAILFATIGLGAGTAQAWPWSSMQEDITAFVTNFCGPENVPIPRGHQGVDNLFGLNTGASELRATATPNTAGLGAGPISGIERLQQAYSGQSNVIKPTYERYGFSGLQWDSYGAGCFATGYWFTPVANMSLNALVIAPMMIAMATLKLALGNVLYTVFTGVISPFVSIFTLIFKGWALWLAPIGIIWAFIRSKGNLREVAKTGAWMLMILGVFLWMGNNTSLIVTKANNFVTEFASTAANQMNAINGVSTGTGGNAVDGINQALWYGVPYQAWLEGTVGPEAAAQDRTRVAEGNVSWGAAILNSKYVGNDDAGREVLKNADKWNTLSYSSDEKLADEAFGSLKTKPGAWTKGKMWEKVPYLFNVKAMCGDTSNGAVFSSSSAEKDNKWFYGGSCDAAAAGTSNMVPYFTGTDYNSRLATATSGGFAALAVCIAVAAASIYLGVQKMLFYFLLLFGPVFLTIAMFGDQKRAAFAKRYFELMIGNVMKQGVAVLVVLFIANAMSMLLYPPADEQFSALREIPWMLKPTLALFFLIGLALFLIPLKNIVTGAVKGDTSVVDKTANMPVDAAKTAAKVGVGVAALAAVVASGGTAAPVVGKLGGMAMSAGKMAGARGGVGKVLTSVGRGANLASRLGGTVADSKNKKGALGALAQGVFARDGKAKEMLSKIPGALDKEGKMTPKGQAIMANAIKKTGKQGEESARAESLQKSYMDKFYKGHLAQTGTHHGMDPNNPANLRAAAVQKEKERMAIKEDAKHGASRTQNMGDAPQNNSTSKQNGRVPEGESGVAGKEAVDSTKEQRAYAEAARENVSGPGFAQDQNIKANVTVDGAQVAQQMGLSTREIAQNPSALITGTAYDGGDTAKMDPRHPASAAMNDLKFAMIVGDQPGIDSASMRASEAISQHGVPSQVSSVSAVVGTSEGMATAIGAMPAISDETPWQVRSEGATSMQAALALVPQDSAVYEPMQSYVSALSNPSVDASTVEGMRALVVESASPELAADIPAPDMRTAIMDSAQRVSVAPESVVYEQGPLFDDALSGPRVATVQAPVRESAPSFVEAEQVQDASDTLHYDLPAEAPSFVAPVSVSGRGRQDFSGSNDFSDARSTQAQYEEDLHQAMASRFEAPAQSVSYDAPVLREEVVHREEVTRREEVVHREEVSYREEGPSFFEGPARDEGPRRERSHEDSSFFGGSEDRHSLGGYSSGGEGFFDGGAQAPISSPQSGASAPVDSASSIFGDIANSFTRSGSGEGGGRGSHAASAPEGLEEISGMPSETPEDNSKSFERSKRRRISGLYDTADTDDDTKGGE